MKEKYTQGMTLRESSTSYNIKNTIITNGSKSTGRKIGFVAVFIDITRRRALTEEATIHTAEMTAMREIQKRRG